MDPQPRTSRGAPQAAPLLYGSVCSGIEAVSLAWQPLGLEAAWFAEIEPFTSAVLAHRYPRVPNLGGMTAIARQVRAGTVPAPDVLVGGMPCQSVHDMAGPAPGAVPEQDGLDRFGLIGDAACGPRHSPSCIADVSATARSQGVKAAAGSTRATRQFAPASHRRTLPTGASMPLFSNPRDGRHVPPGACRHPVDFRTSHGKHH